jgi:hypothetical protein
LLRKFLSLADDAVSQRVAVLRIFPGATALLAVGLCGSGLCSAFYGTHQGADVDVFSTMRAVHALEIKPNSCLCEPYFKVAHYRSV